MLLHCFYTSLPKIRFLLSLVCGNSSLCSEALENPEEAFKATSPSGQQGASPKASVAELRIPELQINFTNSGGDDCSQEEEWTPTPRGEVS